MKKCEKIWKKCGKAVKKVCNKFGEDVEKVWTLFADIGLFRSN